MVEKVVWVQIEEVAGGCSGSCRGARTCWMAPSTGSFPPASRQPPQITSLLAWRALTLTALRLSPPDQTSLWGPPPKQALHHQQMEEEGQQMEEEEEEEDRQLRDRVWVWQQPGPTIAPWPPTLPPSQGKPGGHRGRRRPPDRPEAPAPPEPLSSHGQQQLLKPFRSVPSEQRRSRLLPSERGGHRG